MTSDWSHQGKKERRKTFSECSALPQFIISQYVGLNYKPILLVSWLFGVNDSVRVGVGGLVSGIVSL